MRKCKLSLTPSAQSHLCYRKASAGSLLNNRTFKLLMLFFILELNYQKSDTFSFHNNVFIIQFGFCVILSEEVCLCLLNLSLKTGVLLLKIKVVTFSKFDTKPDLTIYKDQKGNLILKGIHLQLRRSSITFFWFCKVAIATS